jgi:hypothetical protein
MLGTLCFEKLRAHQSRSSHRAVRPVNPKLWTIDLSKQVERAKVYAQSTQRKSFYNLATIWPMNRQFFETIGRLLVRPWKLRTSFALGVCPLLRLLLNLHKIRVDSDNKR